MQIRRGGFTRRASGLATLAAVAALGAAGTAQANTTTVVNGHTLTVTGSAATDVVDIGAAGGVITVNDAPTTLTANVGAMIVVNTGDGDDDVSAETLPANAYNTLTVNGGNGTDLITGGQSADSLNGDAGDDVLKGGPGFDALQGGDGDDTMEWHAGDGLEIDDGGSGADEMDVEGSPTAADDFVADPDLIKQNFVTLSGDGINITFSAEQLTFDGLGGDDVFGPDESQTDTAPRLGQLTTLKADGGDGNDVITGFDGTDTVTGPEGHDQISGGDGDDRLTANGGLDFVAGQAGNDVLVWNDGDGVDLASGGPGFDRLLVNGSSTQGDAFKYEVDSGTPSLVRTAPTPGGVSFGPNSDADAAPEAITLNGLGGDDTFTVAPGTAAPVITADGGTGNDTLTGGDEVDSFSGGPGNDVLDPGRGSDAVDGGDGDDRLFARDHAADRVSGGAGTDSAQTDEVTVDAVDGVENLDATSPPQPPAPSPAAPTATGAPSAPSPAPITQDPGVDTQAPVPTVGRARVVRSHGRLVLALTVGCPASASGRCHNTLTVSAARTAHAGRARRTMVLGRTSVAVAPGVRAHARIRLASAATRLARRGRLPARLRIATTDDAGNRGTRSVAIGLRVPRG